MSTSPNASGPALASGFTAPILIFFLFLCSILLRTHAFEEPIRGSHVWLSAHTVMTLQIWLDEGLSNHHFSPVYTYDNDADRHIRSLTSGLPDEEGNYYYVSYGTFSFLLAFVVLKITGLSPSLFVLQGLNLIIHFLTSLLIYFILCKFYRRPIRGEVWTPGIVGSLIYLFSMHPLWCHTYVYFADTVIQLLWAAGIYMVISIFLYDKIKAWRYIAGFGLLIFIAIQTEWLGLFFAFVVFCFAGIYARNNKQYLKLMAAISIATCLALGLFFFQFASINGFDAFWDASLQKYFKRSGYNEASLYFTRLEIQHILKHYQKLYYPIAGIVLFLLLAAFTIKGNSLTSERKRAFWLLFSILIIPILLHHTIFLGFTKIHDFALLKSSLFAAILIGILYNRCTYHVTPDQKKFYHLLSSSIIGLMMGLSIFSFYDFDRVGDFYIYKHLGEMVKKSSSTEEVLFVLSESDKENGIMVTIDDHRAISPQVQMIAQRNILGVASRSDAIAHLQRINRDKGRIYTISIDGYLLNIESISSAEAMPSKE